MDLSKKASKNLKKNLYLSLCLCIACIAFLLVGLSSVTWAWFSNEQLSMGNSISTADFKLSMSLEKLNKSVVLLSNHQISTEEGQVHQVSIRENGDYEVAINVEGTTSGYCTINFSSGDELLMSQNIKVNLEDEIIKFNVHTNCDLDIEITNINWGNLESYDKLKDDYYFGIYNLIYKMDIATKLPESYIELSYIESDGSQYTNDIVNDGEVVFSFVENIDEESDEIIYKAIKFKEYIVKNENYEELVHLVPCYSVDDNVEGIYDLLNDEFYPNVSNSEFELGNRLSNYCYDGLDFLSVEGSLPEKQSYDYGVANEDTIANCELLLSGFHFIGYKCGEDFIDVDEIENITVEELLREYEPRNDEDIVLEAIYERDTYYLVFDDDSDNPIEVTYFKKVNDVCVPTKDEYEFLGYFDENGNKLFDEQGKFISNKWTSLLENAQKINLHSDWSLIEIEDEQIVNIDSNQPSSEIERGIENE